MCSCRSLLALVTACSVLGPISRLSAQPPESERLKEERAKALKEFEAGLRSSDAAKRVAALRDSRFGLISDAVIFDRVTTATTDPDEKVRQAAYAALVRLIPTGYEKTCEFLVRRAKGEFHWLLEKDFVPIARLVDGKFVLTEENARFLAEQRRLAITAFAVVQPRFRAHIEPLKKDKSRAAEAKRLESVVQRWTSEVRPIIDERLKSTIDDGERKLLEESLKKLSAPVSDSGPKMNFNRKPGIR